MLYFAYHYLTSIEEIKVNLRIVDYFILYPPVYQGLILACTITGLPLCMISIIMLGQFWNYLVPYQAGCIVGNPCYVSMFDYFQNNLDPTSAEFLTLRVGRCGVALLFFSFYVMYYVSGIIVPEDSKQTINKYLDNESFDGNIMMVNLWKRSYFIFISFIAVFYYTLVMQYCFTQFIGLNIWMSLAAIKIIQIFWEEILKALFDDDMLFAPLQIFINTIQALGTMAASNFFDFLFGYFVGLGLSMFER